jgi:hypothetical protein
MQNHEAGWRYFLDRLIWIRCGRNDAATSQAWQIHSHSIESVLTTITLTNKYLQT